MYLDFFGLTSPPFRLTPHPDFFFAGAARGDILHALEYALGQGDGLIKVVADVGAGKTMLCRVLLERMPVHMDSVLIANPALTADELLQTLADELEVSLEGGRPMARVRRLELALIERFAAGRQVVVLVDEAHAMPDESLEAIRLLSNLDHGHSKLLQIVLFGQTELDLRLAQPHLRQLRERIVHSFSLPPLSPLDVGRYLECRLAAAGLSRTGVFHPAAVAALARGAEGLSRRINILADKSMLAAFVAGSPCVDVSHVHLALHDAGYARGEGFFHRYRAFVGAGIVFAVLGSLLLSYLH